MKNKSHYLIILTPHVKIKSIISIYGIKPTSLIKDETLKAIKFKNYEDANKVYVSLIKPMEGNKLKSNYWNYILLNEIAFKEFKELKDKQKFTLQNFKNIKGEDIDLNKLEVHIKEPYGGGVIKGKKSDFTSAFNFWVNSVTKIIKENFELNADLHGGTYNPISLNTLEILVTKSCGDLYRYLNPNKFISAIEMQNNSDKSGCFFVETDEEYYLIDLHCH